MRKLWFISTLVVGLMAVVSASAQQSWASWKEDLRKQAISEGIRPAVFDRAFTGVYPSKRVVKLDRNQPEKRLTFIKYRNTRADSYRIKIGRKALKRNQPLLTQVSEIYGVSPCYIVSFWGLESAYGKFMGKFPVIKSLATLAYDGRRSKFFRKELLYALHIINDGHVNLASFKGEWAGANGQPQFLPSSWYHYAVDHDGDGKRDIWNTRADVFASIANYLKEHGWISGQPWGVYVTLPNNLDRGLIEHKVEQPVSAWLRDGVTLKTNYYINPKWEARIIHPYGGPDMMIFNNFKVIMRWNRSNYYAGTVGYMADKVCYNS